MMLGSPILNMMSKQVSAHASKTVTLQAGQILRGEVLRILPGQRAVLQMDNFRVQAKLEAPLTIGQRSWFQVTSVADPVTLKIVPVPAERSQQKNVDSVQRLLQWLGLKNNRGNQQLLQLFLEQNIPVHRTLMQQAQRLLQEVDARYHQQTLTAIQTVLSKGWPLTPDIVNGVRAFLFDSPLHEQMEQLRPLLSASQQQHLRVFLTGLRLTPDLQGEGIRLFLQQLGLQHEREVSGTLEGRQEFVGNLKYQLQHLLRNGELSAKAKQRIEAILYQLTGQQLFFQNDGGPSSFSQLFFNWIIQIDRHQYPLFGRWEGMNDEQGRADAEHCRMLFYLNLDALGETCLDVQVNNGRISVTIFNENDLQETLDAFKPRIGEQLERIGYTLIRLTAKKMDDMSNQHFSSPHAALTTSAQGVDIRI